MGAKNTGVVCFKSMDDVSTAVATLNGTEFNGSPIEVDVWVKQERDKKDGVQRAKKPNVTVKKQLKAKGKPVVSKADEKVREQLKEVDGSLKVWVGGLDKSTSWQMLQKHFK